MCCTYAARWNTGCKNRQKNRHLGHHRTTLSAVSSQRRHVSTTDNWKNVKQQYLIHISSQYGELRTISGWDRFKLTSLGHPSKFQRVSRVGFVTAATSLNGGQPNFARCLAVSCAGTLYIHFRGPLPHNGILQGAIFTSRPSIAFSYFGSYCTALQ